MTHSSQPLYEYLTHFIFAPISLAMDVQAIRRGTGKSQAEFARAYRIPVTTLRLWERQRSAPSGAAETFLQMIAADPASAAALVEKAFPPEIET